MAQTTYGISNFNIQRGGTEVTWVVSWGLQTDEWFNFQLAIGFSDGPNDEPFQSRLEITRQWVTLERYYPWDLRAWYVVKNEADPISSQAFGFTGLRSAG